MTPQRTPALAGMVAALKDRLSGEKLGGRVARGALTAIIASGTGAVVSFVVQVLLARRLGREAFGAYLLALAWLNAAQLFGKLELDNTSVRFVGSYVATGRWGLLRGYLRASRLTVLSASSLIAVLGAAVVLLFAEDLRGKHADFPEALLVACLMLPVVTLLNVESAILQGFQRIVAAQVPQNILRPLLFGLALLGYGLVSDMQLTAPRAVVGNLGAAWLALLVALVWRRRAMPPQVLEAEPVQEHGTWLRTASWVAAVGIAEQVVSRQTDVIVVGTMLGTAEAAIYGAASQLTTPLGMAAVAVTFVAQPMIADLYSRGDMARLQSLIRAVTWASSAVALPIAMVLALGGPWLLGLYGSGFGEGFGVLLLLVAAQLVVGMVGGVAGFMLTMTSHEREAVRIIGLSAVLNLILAVVLTPRYGAIGTATGTLTANVVRAIALSIYIRRAMGLRVPAL